MRRRRVLGPREEGAVYHVISRVVNRERLFDEGTRDVLRRALARAAGFSGVRVLTFALLSNHFHLLVHIPPPAPVDDAELVRRFRLLYPKPTPHQPLSPQALARRLAAGGPVADAIRRRLLRRMGDLSEFAKTFKQRFSMWLNRSLQRCGPLWTDRFRSLVVQGRLGAVQAVAAYIDLNPVRAGLAEDPRDYRWCGYHEAEAGQAPARHGLARILDHLEAPPPSRAYARELLAIYRRLLFGAGETGREGQARLDPDRVRAVLARGGRLPVEDAARVRLRHLSHGVLLGTTEWMEVLRERLPAPLRRHRPKPSPIAVGTDDLAVLVRPRQPWAA